MFFDQEKHYDKPKYRCLTYDDRRVIENMFKAKKTQSETANAIGLSQSTISRELSRNRGTFQKIHTQEETGLANGPDVLGKLIDSLYYNIVANLWSGVAVAV